MEKVEVVITYLEQRSRPAFTPPGAPRGKVAILRAEAAPAHFYRYLYDHVGAPHNWISRRTISDGDLLSIIHDKRVFLYVLYVDGVPAGLAEIDARAGQEIELKFFGLVPDFVGLGFGRYFLAHAIDLAWSLAPDRLTLETCSLDHPAALPLYQKFGFTVFDQRRGVVERLAPATADGKASQ